MHKMKRYSDMKNYYPLGLLAGVLALVTTPAFAVVDSYLATKAFSKSLPDGTTVPMWGYVLDTGDATKAHCYDYSGAGSMALRLACVTALPDPVVPGPRLTAGVGDPDFRIYLTNGLPEPTSIVITGQEMPWSNLNNGPTWNDGSIGGRTNLSQRVRSFGREAAPNGGRRAYVWNSFRGTPFVKTGTFLYHSGTLPQKQVYMGLYGAVTKDAAVADATAGTPAEAYPGVPYDQEVTLLYSDIDPLLNSAIANGTYTTSIGYHARWFLVNGEPYVAGSTPDIAAGPAGTNTLIRWLNVSSETHVPVLQGLYMTLYAEDGNPYTWQDGRSGVTTPAPRSQYSVMLPPLKTKDAVINAGADGRYAIFDGNGYMTNPSDPADVLTSDTLGGMLRFLAFAPGTVINQPPVANPDTAVTTQGAAVAVAVLANDTDPEGDPLTVTSAISGSANGSVTTNGTTVTYTPTAGFFGTDSFTYVISDGNGNTATGSVTVTVNRSNVAPVANADSAVTVTNVAVTIDVLANDTDADGDILSISGVSQGTNGVVSTDGATVTYTPNTGFSGIDGFTYDIADGFGGSATGNVSVTVNAVGNRAPVANADTASVNEDAILDVASPGVLANDTDLDADPLTAVLDTGPAHGRAGTFVLNGDGSFHYEPAVNFNGVDTFTYHANDGVADSAVVSVSITVNPVNDAPVANADRLFLTQMGTQTFPSPGVLANDTDPDVVPADPSLLTAVLDTGVNRGTLNSLGADGSVSYTLNSGRVGNVASFTYHANDGLADSNIATVTLRRELSVKSGICEFDPQTTTCNWVIQGNLAAPRGTIIEAWLGPVGSGTLIGSVARGNRRAWAINVAGSTLVPNPGDVLNVRAVGRPHAVINDYPVTIQ